MARTKAAGTAALPAGATCEFIPEYVACRDTWRSGLWSEAQVILAVDGKPDTATIP